MTVCSLNLKSSFVLYLAILGCVEDVHGAWLNTVGFGPLQKRKSAFPSTPISIGQRAIVPVTVGRWGLGRGGEKDSIQLFFSPSG